MTKAQQRMDKILEAVCKRIQDEVGGLLGASFVLSDPLRQFISKEEAFEQLAGKQVAAKMDITGDLQGHGCLLLSVKDAIRLGGTLIMLPDNMLADTVSAENYSDDTEDAYGEIANIIAGSYTKVFEEMYPEACRFVRKTQETVLPVKVDIGSDEPVPDQLYYQVVTRMTLNEQQLGDLVMLLPAATFGLETETEVPAATAPEVRPTAPKSEELESVQPAVESVQPVAEAVAPTVKEATPGFDVQKHRKRVDTLLEQCRQKMGTEMGALLGVEVTLSSHECRLVSKENFFLDEAAGKQVLAHMDVVGDLQDKSYLFVGLRDAIYIGGTLIMLPQVELDKAVADEDFGDDAEDAYGEIANIVSGVFTSIFEEQYTKKVRFVKTGLERVLPLKVETEADTPLPNQFYYMSSSSLNMGGRDMGKVQMLFPAAMLQLDGLLREEQEGQAQPLAAVSVAEGQNAAPAVAATGTVEAGNLDILVVSDDAREAEKISDVLAQHNLGVKMLTFKENVTDYLPGEVRAVFLVMSNVNEKAFAVAIKISATCSLPLIAAGREWTRSKVITAVKYGVSDILLTPASSSDIAEKIKNISVKLAA